MKYFFILGARDPEMMEIMRVLKEHGHPFALATIKGVPVRSRDAYHATGFEGLLPKDHQIVFVECAVMGLLPDEVCDHHNPGDPGYGLAPDQYMKGSSLGQILELLGLEPTPEQRIIAAADHCLRHAYAGQCPGVDPKDLAAWRERSRAEIRGISVEEMRRQIEEATQQLREAPRIYIAGEEVAWFPGPMHEQIPEASARTGIPFCYARREGSRGKCGIMGAPPHVIRAWMRECSLKDVYGDPARGFAGGYL